jgi:hypothetical protein
VEKSFSSDQNELNLGERHRDPEARCRVKKYVVLLLIGVGAFLVFELGCALICNMQTAARKAVDQNNLKQIGIALYNHASTYQDKMPAATIPLGYEPPEKRLSWMVMLLPYLECGSPFHLFNKGEPWDSERNLAVGLMEWKTFRCPSLAAPKPLVACEGLPFPPGGVRVKKSEEELSPYSSSYVGISGVGPHSPYLSLEDRDCGFFGHDRQISIGDIKDGSANTLAVIETGRQQGCWSAGGRPTLRWIASGTSRQVGTEAPFGRDHGSWYWRGAEARTFAVGLMADGSTRILTPSISPQVLRALATIAGDDRPDSVY